MPSLQFPCHEGEEFRLQLWFQLEELAKWLSQSMAAVNAIETHPRQPLHGDQPLRSKFSQYLVRAWM